MSDRRARKVIMYIISGLLYAAAVMLMMASIGCKAAPAAKPHMAIPCPDIGPLSIPSGITSNQLDDILYTAYLDVLGQYIACQQQVAP